MISTETAPEPRRCLGCRHVIRSAEALTTGYGAGCRAKIRKAARTADLSQWTLAQVAEAREAIEDGAVVPSTRPGVFHVVSSDGTEVHKTAEHGCNCTNGLQTKPPRACWHRCAVVIALAASAPAPRPVPAPEPVAVPAPRDLLAELEAMVEFELALA